jgi:hypothetical protein
MEEAVANARWLESRRRTAWAEGREHVDHLLSRYAEKYRLDTPPPPALIAAELIRDILDVPLFFDPMPLDRFAEVRLVDGCPRITVNSEIRQMENVKDPDGVANVAMLHEIMHLDRHLPELIQPASMQFEGFDDPPAIVCLRAKPGNASSEVAAREFWAEEAGRAGAISFPHLVKVPFFDELMSLAQGAPGQRRSAWPLLYRAAEAIGVNSTALKKQLELEGFVSIEAGELTVQPTLGAMQRWT